MFFVRGASCLSKHICISAGLTWLFSSVCLSFALSCAWSRPPSPPARTLMTLMLLIAKLIKPPNLVLHLTSQRLGSTVSVVHTAASFLQNLTELPSVEKYVFIDLHFKSLVCFEECMNQIRLAPASSPLGAEEEGNHSKLHSFFVMSFFNGVQPPGTRTLRQIISVIPLALLQSLIWIHLTVQRQRESVQY